MKPAATDPANPPAAQGPAVLLARGRRLEYLTIAWNAFEAAVALAAGAVAGSVALTGFGLDSVIETASAAILLWRFRAGAAERRERAERRAHRLVGICFLLLALYIVAQSTHALWSQAMSCRRRASVGSVVEKSSRKNQPL